MDLKVRNTSEKDYPKLYSWWKWWRWETPPSLDILPNNGNDGVMVSYNGLDICAGFVYKTSSAAMMHCEFIVSNPEFKDKKVREYAKRYVIESITEITKSMGGRVIYTSLKNQSLIKDYKACGYRVGSTDTIEMVKIIE